MVPLCVRDHPVVGGVQGDDDRVGSQLVSIDEHAHLVGRESPKASGTDPFAGKIGHRHDLRAADENMLELHRSKANHFQGQSPSAGRSGPAG